MGENPMGLIGKGSWAMTISPGLVDPKCSLIMIITKGKRVNIPAPRSKLATIEYDRTLVDRFLWTVVQTKCIHPGRSVELRTGPNHEWPTNSGRLSRFPKAHENDRICYSVFVPKPTRVSLG